MSNVSKPVTKLPPEQEAIRAKCFHPTGTFVEFKKNEIEQSIPERFEKIVRNYPERLAVKHADRSYTYDALNKAANRLACAVLQRCGDRKETVGILLSDSGAAIIAILGLLKAGKVLVGLDASFPLERMRSILGDSQAKAIITDNDNVALARQFAAAEHIVINMDDLNKSLPLENPALLLLPEDLALIIYTSGSTGTPKGVLRDHRTRLHQIMWKINTAHVSPEDRCLVLHAPSSSGFFLELFRALLSGASCFPFDVKQHSMSELSRLLIQEKITIYRSLSSMFRTFAQTLTEQKGFPHLRLIHVSGEPLYRHDVKLYQKYFAPRCVMLNHFGASEGGEICNYFIDHQSQITGNIVPVGFPVGDKEISLLDEEGKEVGYNEVGEIIVKSQYLSLGYWQNTELTAKSFLSDSTQRKEQRYKTGDFGRMMPDGCIVHLGRKDTQVKIRGYRIEIAEIEAALLEHPAVKECAVTAWGNELGDKHLIAYVNPGTEPPPTNSELLNFLKGKIPEYMLPSGVVFLKNFPLTNGKIDRRSLPRPERVRPTLDRLYTRPQNPLERQLAAIWEELLDIRPIGIYDNFFDLGGHSLAATRLVSRIIKQFQLEIPLQSLFQSPTVAQMAAVITEHQAKLGDKELAGILVELESMSEDEAQKSMIKEFLDRLSMTPEHK
jgi:amino acid adenylation domain-containing protein